MQILMDDPNDRGPRSSDEMQLFIDALDAWKENELAQNPSNSEKINRASNLIFDCYINYYPNLDLSRLDIREVPSVLSKFDHLVGLSLRGNENINLESFTNLENLTNLTTLSLRSIASENIADHIPASLTRLSQLDMRNNNITEFPINILQFSNLTSLCLKGNMISSIPNEITQLQRLQNLDISGNRLEEIPVEQFNLMTSLTSLDVSGNGIYNGNQIERIIIIRGLDELNTHNTRIGILRDNFDNRGNLIGIQNQSPHQIPTTIEFFLQNLISLSQFSDEEKGSTDIKSIGLSQETLPSSNSKILSEKLGEILEFYSSTNESQNPAFSKVLEAIKRFTDSRIFTTGGDDFKKQLSRELLGILYKIHEKRGNQDLITQYQIIAEDSLQDCHDRNIFMIFQLKNLCNKLDSNQVSELLGSDQKNQFLNYLSQQIIFFKVINLASLHVEEIKKSNPGFSEDVEVYLNYIRVFNNEFGIKFSLNLPSISTQNYFEDHPVYRVNPNELAKLNEIYSASQEGNFRPLFEMLAQSIAMDSYSNINEKYPEINEQSFIASIKQEINGIALDFLTDLESLTAGDDSEVNQAIKVIICADITQLQISTLKDIVFKQLMAIKENRELITSLTEDKVREITQKFKENYLTSLKTNVNGRTTDLLTLENASAIDFYRPSSPRNPGAESASQELGSRTSSPRQ